MPKLLYLKCPTVTYYYDPTVEFLLGQLFHTLIYNEVGLPLWLVVLLGLLGYIEKPLTTKPFLILSKSLRETLGHIGKKNGRQKNPQQMMKLGHVTKDSSAIRPFPKKKG